MIKTKQYLLSIDTIIWQIKNLGNNDLIIILTINYNSLIKMIIIITNKLTNSEAQ